MKFESILTIVSITLGEVLASLLGDAYLVGMINSQRGLDLVNQNLSELPSQSKMLRPSVESIEHNIKYTGSILCPPESIEAWSCKSCLEAAAPSDMKHIKYFYNNVTDAAGYIAVNTAKQTILLVFRGAHSPINDLLFTDSVTVHSDFIPPNAKVNHGALIIMKSLSSQFIDLTDQLLKIPEYKNYTITLIGHSLGSTTAPLALIKLQKHFQLPWERFNLYCYGQTRIGNYHFAQWFNSHPITAVRVANSLDFVTQYPTKSFGYHTHHQNLYYIDQITGTAKFCRSDIMEDPECFIYSDIGEKNNEHHLVYLGMRMKPSLTC